MSDKFLGTGGSNISLSNGTATIFGATIGAINLEPSQPIKTNSIRQLVSSKLNIVDINNLDSELNLKNELSFTENDTHTNPQAGQVKLYVKTDGEFYKKDSAGNETAFGGGGGVSTTNPPVVDEAIAVFDGTTGNFIKYKDSITYWRKKGLATVENFYIGNLSGNAPQTTSTNNIGIGNNSLEINETGIDNIGIGNGAGKNVFNCHQNIAIGGGAGFYKQGASCVNNIAIGITSQQGVSGSTTGQYNNSLGSSSLTSLTTGSFNTAIGNNAGFSLTTGTENTFIGAFCADGNADDIGNTAIGKNCLTNGGTNRTCLGKQAETDADNQVCIGNSAVVEIRNLGNNNCDLGSSSHQFKDIYLGGKATLSEIEIAGTGAIQRPFIIQNPTYSKSLEIEREALGMGIIYMDGATSKARINTVNNDLGITSTSGNIELSATKIIGLPYILSFACSDETTAITTTGLKISLRAPQDFQLSKIKISLNTQAGFGFIVALNKNNVQVGPVAVGNNFFITITNTTIFLEDDLITLNVSNVGSSTGTGLKCYLIGKTI